MTAAALDIIETAESQGHDSNECAALRWECHMLLGDFERAWLESDGIAGRASAGPTALWDREPFTAKRVVIRCLHGYGDAIQFLRYARLMRAQARKVIVETHPEMVSLIKRIPGVDQAIAWGIGESLSRRDWDQQIEVTELPWAFRTTPDRIPADVPYIRISLAAISKSAALLGSGSKPRIGLMWASSGYNPARSMHLDDLEPLLRLEGFDFFSFQRGSERGQLIGSPLTHAIFDTAEHSPDIHATAADLCNMDLVITVDTMLAHLAGALARPVWVMLPFEADWRWMLARSDTPWYPTMRLFRQQDRGHWKPVVDQVAAALSLRHGVSKHPGCRIATCPAH